jgi:long-chain acyl-CoA synthetase
MPHLWNLHRIAPQPHSVLGGETIPALFWNAVALRGDRVWLRQKELGIWRSHTWREVGEAVREIAGGLLALGLAPGETVSILSNTVIEWVLADLAVLSCGGVANGIYPTDAASQVEYLCEDSATTVLFVENDEQLDKALEVRGRLPRLRRIVVFDMKGLRGLQDDGVIGLEQLRALGRGHLAGQPDAVAARTAAVRPGDLAILVYTSGTTGKPKGAMHSHQGLVHTVRGYNTILPRHDSDECMCFLPLCHIAERVGGEYFSLYTGARLNFVENPETVPENMREIAPTVCTGVPRVWEKYYSAVTLALREATALQRAGYAWALGVGTRVADAVLFSVRIPQFARKPCCVFHERARKQNRRRFRAELPAGDV